MEGDDEGIDASAAYRVPQALVAEESVRSSWRSPSPRVLGALARLSRMRAPGEHDDSDGASDEPATGERPARPRCTEGNEALRCAELRIAEHAYRKWLAATMLSDEPESRFEATLGLAASLDDPMARATLVRPLIRGELFLPHDAPAPALSLLARTHLWLGDDDAAEALLHRADRQSARALAIVRAEIAAHRGRAIDTGLARYAEPSSEREACAVPAAAVLLEPADERQAERRAVAALAGAEARTVIARTRWVVGDKAAAASLFRDALATFRSSGRVVEEATTLAYIAELFAADGRRDRGLDYAAHAVRLVQSALPGAFAAKLPVLRGRARLLAWVGRTDEAAAIDAEIGEIRAGYYR